MRERRNVSRVEFQRRVELLAPKLQTGAEASSLNVSEGGLCLRIQQTLEIRSSVTLRVFAQPRRKPFECMGRVAWVVQRRDLRDAPPFLYDVGVEFVGSPACLRAIVSKIGLPLKPSRVQRDDASTVDRPSIRAVLFQPVIVHGRCYQPHVKREPPPNNRWHLVITVDGAPCFSHRYALARDARQSWEQFKRHLVPAYPRDRTERPRLRTKHVAA